MAGQAGADSVDEPNTFAADQPSLALSACFVAGGCVVGLITSRAAPGSGLATDAFLKADWYSVWSCLGAVASAQPEVTQAFTQLPHVTKAVAGVGFWGPGESTLYDAAEERDRQALRRLGGCADISGVFLSADGEPVKAELTERMIGIDAEQMRAIPEVIVIVFGMAKVPAMRAALRSGLVGGVITHTALAQALLDVT